MCLREEMRKKEDLQKVEPKEDQVTEVFIQLKIKQEYEGNESSWNTNDNC